MSKVKSIGEIIRELFPMITDSVKHIKSCRKIVKDKSCENCRHLYACNCDNLLKINTKK